jgi:hypothetical protein
MLIVPASNVSTPVSVVMRTLSRVPPKETPPDEIFIAAAEEEFAAPPFKTQAFVAELTNDRVNAPYIAPAAWF